ncbi:probable LRR receptor-like serine/threonine-protein kinase At1g29720 isoform X4 [Populus trichocarpa]|uniref:probable LRR receptor-like serine/threonine-protein kinase At1g29720 isoform X4 n=1 Tax=Populus trichocarpa TaxID=3694 RepID=UPI002279257F|nr:probable LRR receptor-like serine/threonine-protein kinase At1g29720 isoform X4 [Populus trichocarpa]
MLMMFQLCQVMVMISFWSSITLLASDQLHPGEVEALRQIGKTVNEDGQLSLKFVDRCQQSGVVETVLTSAPPNLEGNSTIECNCSITDDNYCHITSFQLKDYSLPGRLPPELANLTYVQKIDFTRNYLYGTIPVEWASMKYLSFISLTANRLSGNIPAHLGSFTALAYLSLESNQFSGVVPPELGKLVNLKNLILSGNKLVGTLPEALAQIKDLKDFRVSDNNLNGTVPEFIGNWTQLQKLELYATGLQGPIPLAIFHLEKLSDLRIADMPGPEFQLPKKPIERKYLVLRNINLAGTIPEDAWKVEKTLDLTFNKLVGEIPPTTIRRQFTFLSGNKLTGTVQDSFLQNSQNLDVSYNNFSRSPRCSSSNGSDLLPCSEISRCPKYYRSFYINCGGQDVKNGRILYEGDQDSESNAAARSYYRLGSNWGFSSTGDFMDDNNFNDNKYTLQSNSNISLVDFGLYATARKTPLSITYYGYCLENGNYTVRLHFAEIQFTDEKLYNKVARRVFDIYIQGIQVQKDFNFTEEAKGSNRNFTIAFNTAVTDRTLEIRLYWAGKGTTSIPRRGNYGPIISAISVCSGYRTYCEEPEEASKKPIVIGVVTSAAFLILLVMGVIYWKFCYGDKYTRERGAELKGLDLKTGSFTLRQLKATPDNFNSENKIGEGGLGSVYKGETSSLI